jgi:hypothetical protein
MKAGLFLVSKSGRVWEGHHLLTVILMLEGLNGFNHLVKCCEGLDNRYGGVRKGDPSGVTCIICASKLT